MNSTPKQQNNDAAEALKLLELLSPAEQLKVLDYITSIYTEENEQEDRGGQSSLAKIR